MRRVSRALIVTAALSVVLHGTGWFIGGNAQRQRRRAPSRPRPPATTRIDYSKFLHSTREHQAACLTCHKLPTKNWREVRAYPDVADYPDHDACVGCHRRQFFRGAKPPICSVCHTKVSPRDDNRFVFRKPASGRQFQIEFPHDRHQDVIARRLRRLNPGSSEFRRASWSYFTAQERKTYNNCSICHSARSSLPQPPASGWLDGYVPDQLTFKTVPEQHGACFNCHWKAEEPVGTNCAGCHKLAPSPIAPYSIKRISMKFKHDGGGEKQIHIQECTSCHINITKAASLRGLKPDVPITSCTECHNREGLRLDVSKELESIDKQPDFVCSYCHTSDTGRLDPPAGHYLIAGREPIKRKGIK